MLMLEFGGIEIEGSRSQCWPGDHVTQALGLGLELRLKLGVVLRLCLIVGSERWSVGARLVIQGVSVSVRVLSCL